MQCTGHAVTTSAGVHWALYAKLVVLRVDAAWATNVYFSWKRLQIIKLVNGIFADISLAV